MEQKKKLETADLLEEAARQLKKERQNIISETPAGMARIIELQTLENKCTGQADALRVEVQKVMGFPLHGTQCKRLKGGLENIARQRQFLREALEQFQLAEFDVVEEFRQTAAKAAEELAVCIRGCR